MIQISIWTLSLEAVPDVAWPVLTSYLDEHEQARAARYIHDRHRHQYIAAHALKRMSIAAFAGVPQGACRFDVMEGGKPVLTYPKDLHFNLSHCEGRVAVAASFDVPIGIDVEHVPVAAPLEIAPMVLAPAELAWLEELSPAARHEGFIRLWTLKEAFIKATGRGLVEPLDSFAIAFEPLGLSFCDPSRTDSEEWSFYERRLGAHRLALAWRGRARAAVSFHIMNGQKIADGSAHSKTKSDGKAQVEGTNVRFAKS